MKYATISKIIRTKNKIFLKTIDFALVEKEGKKVKILDGDLFGTETTSFENPNTISEDSTYFASLMSKEDQKLLEQVDYHNLRIELLSQNLFFEVDTKNNTINPSTKATLALELLKDEILCQDKKLEELIGALDYNQQLYNSQISDDAFYKLKKNIIISGPKGVGKTESIIKALTHLELNYSYIDLSKHIYTAFDESNMDEIIVELLAQVNYDQKEAEKSVIVFDNLDKLSDLMTTDNPGLLSDYILKMINTLNDKRVVNIKIENNQESIMQFNKAALTLVFVGDFEKLNKYTREKTPGYSINEETLTFREKYEKSPYLKEILDVITNIIEYNNLTKSDLKNILLSSKISPLYLKQLFYQEQGCNLDIKEETIDQIIEEAIKRKNGAKGLKQVLDEKLNKEDYIALNKLNVTKITLMNQENRKKVKVRKITK